MYLSYLAAQTERVHVGSAIFNITPKVNHPARVAETVALLDHITKGRFEFGTGRGSSTTEVFGFDIDDLDETTPMWDEAVREIPKMWKDGQYSYEGTYFRMPRARGLPEALRQRAIRPCGSRPGALRRSPRPARWASVPSASRTARPSKIAPLIQSYKDAVANAEPVGDYVNDNIMVVTNMICMEDREEAFEMAVNIGHELLHEPPDALARQHPEARRASPCGPISIPEPTVEQLKKAAEIGMVVVGDPDDCAKAVQRWVDIGADQLCFSPTTSNMGQDEIIESMELFGKEVIPQFDKDPVHRTHADAPGRVDPAVDRPGGLDPPT